MSDTIVSNRTLTFAFIIAIAAMIVVGYASYNFGNVTGLKERPGNNLANTPVANQPINNTIDNDGNINSDNNINEEINEPPAAALIHLNGKIAKVSSTGFTLNEANKTGSTYEVLVNDKTKMTEETTSLSLPTKGGFPKVISTSKGTTLQNLKKDDDVSVVGTKQGSRNLIATEVIVLK